MDCFTLYLTAPLEKGGLSNNDGGDYRLRMRWKFPPIVGICNLPDNSSWHMTSSCWFSNSSSCSKTMAVSTHTAVSPQLLLVPVLFRLTLRPTSGCHIWWKMNKNSNACHLRWKRCFRFVLALVKVSAFRLFFSSTISFGGQKSAVVAVSPLIVLVVAQVRSLRGPDVEAVIISSGSREGSVVDKEFLATEENLRSARLIFSSPEALAY